ncbi:MAG: hypothetical protein D6741_04360 [Planctomycetota bacterium]|nr:MAG: hypothetical protein D6741_04360 [Planctomycetota bacterium]
MSDSPGGYEAPPFTAEELRQRGYEPEDFDLEELNRDWTEYCEMLVRVYGQEEAARRLAQKATRTNFLAAAFLTG